MDDRRDAVKALAWRAPVAGGLWLIGWHFLGTPGGVLDPNGQPFLALACIVAGAIVIARPFSDFIGEPAGSLFYPRSPTRPEPTYSGAQGRRMRGRFDEAIAEYQRIAEAFPAEVYPHTAMIEIALLDLKDRSRAEAIVSRALVSLRDADSRKQLLWMHGKLEAKLREASVGAPATSPGQADESESRDHDD